MLEALEGAARAGPRLWRVQDGHLVQAFAVEPAAILPLPQGATAVPVPEGGVVRPLGTAGGLWLETPSGKKGDAMLALFSLFLRADREASALSAELAARYQEIDLLYTLNDILGQTLRLDKAAATIIRAVSEVVGARRASLAVLDEATGTLEMVAAQGFELPAERAIPLDDPTSVAARVVRQNLPESGVADPGVEARGYRAGAYLSVPIVYRPPGGEARCVGVINLTDRRQQGRFSATDEKLVSAAANQIGAAIELSRMVAKQREQQRMQDELALAHHLQLSLLPKPSVLAGDAEVAVRCLPAEQVGGDFYTFNRLGLGLVGVMLGDVSSHGIAAAMVMAAVVSAAGIHATAGETPDLALVALLGSLSGRLASADTYFTVFYGILDPVHRRLTWANAGHPHAFRISATGEPERLEATAPPLGLGPAEIGRRSISWAPEDLLCLWTDGLVDAEAPGGERFGEARLLAALTARRSHPAETIVSEVMAEADHFAPNPADDRTLLVLRL